MAQGGAGPIQQLIPFRACCGRLRWALLEAVGAMPAGAHVVALRWGAAEIPLDLGADGAVGGGSPASVVPVILDAAQRRLGPAASCYAGQGVLVIDARGPAEGDRGTSERKGGIGDGVP